MHVQMSWTDAGCGRRCCSETCDLGLCKQCAHRTRITRTFSRAHLAQGKDLISIRAMSPPSQSPPDAAHFAQHPALPHLQRGPHGGTCATQWTVWPSCHPKSTHRLRAQPHLGGYHRSGHTCECNIKKASFCSTNISVEKFPTVTLLTSEVDDTRIGRLASPLLEQKREATVILAGVYHSQRENSTAH